MQVITKRAGLFGCLIFVAGLAAVPSGLPSPNAVSVHHTTTGRRAVRSLE